jgi:hypothetical protein
MPEHTEDELLDDSRHVHEARKAGVKWTVIATDLGCTLSQAHKLHTHYQAHLAEVAARNQLELFYPIASLVGSGRGQEPDP